MSRTQARPSVSCDLLSITIQGADVPVQTISREVRPVSAGQLAGATPQNSVGYGRAYASI